jgi:hypothetical protein
MSASVISGIGELQDINQKNLNTPTLQSYYLQVKHNGQGKNKACDCEVYPLHILQCLGIILGFEKEDV